MDLTSWTPRMLSILRIVTGLLFLEHGTGKLWGFPPSDHAASTLFSLIGVQGALELVGGLLILIGLFTRPVAFVLAGDMAVAYFMAHAPKSFLSDTQRRSARHPILLRVPLSGGRRRRRVERR
jgi:putative oxidoreductase